jgi:3-oxoacyl-[acyl-carrier-protein] synthase II
MIRSGDADAMLAGAADSYLTHLEVAAFASAGVLSTKYNDAPERASRPFDQDRDGFVIAEGSAIVFMEEYEKAKERGANIYCEVIGFGMAGEILNHLLCMYLGWDVGSFCARRCYGYDSYSRRWKRDI